MLTNYFDTIDMTRSSYVRKQPTFAQNILYVPAKGIKIKHNTFLINIKNLCCFSTSSDFLYNMYCVLIVLFYLHVDSHNVDLRVSFSVVGIESALRNAFIARVPRIFNENSTKKSTIISNNMGIITIAYFAGFL